ncbi:hypothetical protein DMENIID0001_046270 [Sergentomyia squamirostris]
MFGDRVFNYPMVSLVDQYLKYADVSKNPIFIYKFAFRGNYTFFKFFTGTDNNPGPGHFDDLIYLFSMPSLFPYLDSSTPEGKMSDIYGTHNGPEVCAKDGCVRGKYESGWKKPYEAFYGIPYAEPPIGKLRFENPLPYAGWSGYWDASYYRNDCYQKNYFLPGQPISGSEDCLHLNIYRPSNWNSKSKLSVLVYIHGGGYISFSSNPDILGPDYFMANGGVILVTLNYRLGLFGFMCSGDKAVKGNFGLKDQQLALQWVARNIEAFGGDSKSVTLAGESAGGASVNLHMLNPISQSLFHRVILLDGVLTAPWIYPIDFLGQMRKTARFLGLVDWKAGQAASTYSLAEQLKNVNALSLVQAVDNLFTFVATSPVPVRPCIEGDWEGAFLTKDPLRMWAEGDFTQKPILTGTNSEVGVVAGVIPTNLNLLATFNENIYEFLPIQLDFPPRYASQVMKYYFGDKDYIDDTNVQQYYKMFGDRMFNYPMVSLVDQYLKYADVSKNPIFIYKFAFRGNYTFFRFYTGTDDNPGPGLFDDLIYLFSMPSLFPYLDSSTPEGKMSDIYVRTMVTFAQTRVVKKWRPFEPCTATSNDPLCDYQIFDEYTNLDPFESNNFSFVQYTGGSDEYLGVSHMDDAIYLFTMPTLFPIFNANTPESRMSDIYVRTMVTFAQTGVVKKWRPFRSCTALTDDPFCEYQVFKRYTELDPNQVIVSVSNEIYQEMIKLWSKIDAREEFISPQPCNKS